MAKTLPSWSEYVQFKWFDEFNDISVLKCLQVWNNIKSDFYKFNLGDDGVDLPQHIDFRVRGKENLTAYGLQLIMAKLHQGNAFSIRAMTKWIEHTSLLYGRSIEGTQQVRHLSRQHGWYILNKGDQIPGSLYKMPAGWHMMINTTQCKPNFPAWSRKARKCAQLVSFDQKKIDCGFRCLTCGGIEGQTSRIDPTKEIVLVEGHMNPRKPNTDDNTFPQCTVCNRHKDNWVYDVDGQTYSVSNSKPVMRADSTVRRQILIDLLGEESNGGLEEIAKMISNLLTMSVDI